MIGTTIGRYRILSLIGSGGMGEVYKALDTRLEREVAVKVLLRAATPSASARSRFRAEALALSRVSHPNIATVHDFDSDGGFDYLVMEYIAGLPLSRKLEAGPLSADEAVRIARQVASALAEAHAAGIVHRDLKPGNILIDSRDRAKVIDFGLAEFVHPGDTDAVGTMSARWGAAGTLPYMAPEQLRAGILDARTDIFALGGVVYEMLTGRRPFSEQVAARLIDAILNEEPPPPSTVNRGVSLALDAVVVRCLKKRPSDRYQSAAEVIAVLDTLASLGPGPEATRNDVAQAGRMRPEQVTSILAAPAKVQGREADQFLSDAVPATLSARLAGREGLDVKMPPSAADVARVGGDLAAVARAYGVSACVMSTITITGRRMLLSLQVFDPKSRTLLWSGDFEGSKARYLPMVREAADRLRAALRPTAPAVALPPSASTGSGSSEAEILLQRGMYHTNQFVSLGRSADYDRAVSALEGALSRDPRRVAAAEGLAVLQIGRLTLGTPRADVEPAARMWAQRALEIDSRSSRAWAVLSELEDAETPDGSRQKIAYALRAATFGPRDAFAQTRLCSALARRSLWLAIAASRQASSIDPLVLAGPIFESVTSVAFGRFEDAIKRADDALALEPETPFGVLMNAMISSVCGREAEALALIPRLAEMAAQRRLHPQWVEYVRLLAEFARASNSGDREAADAHCRALVAAGCGETPFPRWQSYTSALASVLARHDRVEDALALLEARTEAGVADCLDLYLLNPHHRPLRGDPRFAAAVARAQGEFDALLAAFDEARSRGEVPGYIQEELEVLLKNLRSPHAG